jgi:hypothetical protein
MTVGRVIEGSAVGVHINDPLYERYPVNSGRSSSHSKIRSLEAMLLCAVDVWLVERRKLARKSRKQLVSIMVIMLLRAVT